jgi:phosphatidylglycerophosphatase A
MIKKFNSLLVTMFGIGKVKFAPGTFGSLATIIILFYLFNVLKISSNIILIGLLIIFIYSFYAVSTHIKDSENKDPGEIVIDEFLGQSIPIYLYEVSHSNNRESTESIIFYGLFFLLFRYFDIIKPFPVNFFDKNFKNSFGVIMDDICAGLYVVLTVYCFMIVKSYIL